MSVQDPTLAFTSSTASVTGDRLVFHFRDCLGEQAPPSPNVYRWSVSGGSLTITRVSDPKCPDRPALFVGVWKRK